MVPTIWQWKLHKFVFCSINDRHYFGFPSTLQTGAIAR
uniref:Uncharacterized protein n=1 Tax=Arundo donax TaxID=35708 RepID=A0A0A8ZNP0_ARUDO